MMYEAFEALVVNQTVDSFSIRIQSVTLDELPAGEVLIKVAWSSVNYKDGLASIPNGKIVGSYPFIPGIDLSGHIVSSADPRFREGQAVIASGYGIGVSHYGGFSEYARISADWVMPVPDGLDVREAMIYGTAGFTAALSIEALEKHGISPEKGKVLVTGATGGVGSTAVAMLSKKGYHVVASTGNSHASTYIKRLGAAEIISREDVTMDSNKPLGKQLWSAAVDSVGGATLAAILSKIAYGGSVAASGLTAGVELGTTVLPFILRGVNLLGIDSVNCAMDVRTSLWERMGAELKPTAMNDLVDRTVALHELPKALDDILHSKTIGRILVKISE